jgi:hypothetical protein
MSSSVPDELVAVKLGLIPLTLLGVAPILGSVALMAYVIPEWRAARVDPTVALRGRLHLR